MFIKKIFGYRFVSATFWMFVGSFFSNGGAYLYHLLMGRLLGPSLYGVLESVISLLYILSIPLTTLTLVIVKFSSTYKGQGNLRAVFGLYNFLKQKLIFYGLLFSLLIFIFSPLLTSFFHLSQELILLLIIVFFLGLFNILVKSLLQGLTNFVALAAANLAEALMKIFSAMLLVILGFQVLGAFASLLVGALIGFFVAWRLLRKVIVLQGVFNEQKKLLIFSIPVFLSNLGLISLFTTDILLVRHFFPGVESGYYAALSVLGKIIFFAASPIALVMFPLVSEHYASRKRYSHFLFLSLILTLTIVILLTFIYFLFSNLVTSFLFGKAYLAVSPLLGYFAIFMSLYTLSSLFANFYLSIHKTRIIGLVVITSILQIFLIWFFHTTLFEVIKVSIITTLLLLIGLMIYYPYAKSRS